MEDKKITSASVGKVNKPTKSNKINRRTFFSWLALGWGSICRSYWRILYSDIIRFLYPNVLFEPPQSFKIGFPEDFSPNTVDIRFKKEFNVWIVRDEESIFALSTVCTHLGCTPNWLTTESKFKCPCHGSGFRMTGVHFEGPARDRFERYSITVANDGQLLVDKN